MSLFKTLFLLSFLFLFAGCGNGFQSNASLDFQKTIEFSATSPNIDVLFVVDNSPKMTPLQQNLINNFSGFIQELNLRNVDYQIGVVTTDAFLEKFYPTSYSSLLRSANSTESSNVSIITPTTASPETVFAINALQGDAGHSDERGLESFEEAFKNTNNSSFFRENAHLAVIFVTNEDDFSHADGSDCYGTCAYSALDPLYTETSPGVYSAKFKYYSKENPDPFTGKFLNDVSRYSNLLANSHPRLAGQQMHSFHTYAIHDHACRIERNALDTEFKGRLIAKRYSDLIDLVGGGVKASICKPPQDEIKRLAQGVVAKTLSLKVPDYSAYIPFKVFVNGKEIPLSAKDQASQGAYFNSAALQVFMLGADVPAVDASIRIEYSLE